MIIIDLRTPVGGLSITVKGAIGAGAAILIVVILLIVVCCFVLISRSKRKRMKPEMLTGTNYNIMEEITNVTM